MSDDIHEPWQHRARRWLPPSILHGYRRVRADWSEWRRRTVITEPGGRLIPLEAQLCALLIVGRSFDQRKPDAMMTCRMGYARAFEQLGIPYLFCDWRDAAARIADLPRAFAMVFGADLPEMSSVARRALAQIPTAVWVNPWFDHEQEFFAGHGLRSDTWVWSESHRAAVLELAPKFGFTATVPSGMNYFEGWSAAGLRVISLPLACDTSLYTPEGPVDPEFARIELAFVGGYWESKGRALDRYLRPFESQLTVYGYNRWPYRGYRGQLAREREPALYRQARLCPVINEPTVALLKGQINERVFKVLGSGGTALVDAVPSYRELFAAEELAIPRDEVEFESIARMLLIDPERRRDAATRGRAAVLARHTYVHRAREVLAGLRVELPEGCPPR